MHNQPEKGNAPVVGATEALSVKTQEINQGFNMSNCTQVVANRAITVPFHGAHLYVVEHNGQPYTPMRPIVEGMGLTWPSQFRKLAANKERWGVSVMETPLQGVSESETPVGGVQKMLAMPLRKLPGWLANIEAGKVKSPEARARVIQYQNECDDALWQYWNDGMAVNPRAAYSVHPDQTLSAEQAETLRLMLTDHVKKLPKAKQAGAMIKGWSKLKAHFKTDYRHIPAGEFHEAVSIIARHTAEFVEVEVVENEPRSVNEIVERLVRQIEAPNGTASLLFMPLVNAVLRKQGFTFLLPDQQAKEVSDRLNRLAATFNPLNGLYDDVRGIRLALAGLHPRLGMPEPAYRQLLPMPN